MGALNLTPDELTARWSMKGGTLKTWRYRGKGPRFIKVGKKVLYPLVEVEAFEAKNLHSANSVLVERSQP